MTPTNGTAAVSTASKVRCGIYAAIAIAALVATWSQNLAYADNPGGFLLDFVNDTKVTAASRSITVDILLFFLAAAVFMVVEARKRGIRFVWAYIVGGAAVAISVTFPLFLIARELRSANSDPTRLGVADTVLLGILGIGVLGLSVWVVMG